MADQDHLARVWDIIERAGVCMLTTHAAHGLHARPLQPRPDRAAGLIWFVTDLRSGKEHEIEAESDVGLVHGRRGQGLSVDHRARRNFP